MKNIGLVGRHARSGATDVGMLGKMCRSSAPCLCTLLTSVPSCLCAL